MEKMQIVHVTECLAGGVLTFLLNLTKALDEEQHVIIYSRRDNTPDNVESLFGSNVQMVPWKYARREIRVKWDFLALVKLLKLLRQFPKADVIQLHSSKAGFLGRLACRLLGRTRKVFYLPHGLSFAREDVGDRKKKFYTYLEKLGNSFCGDIVACSDSEKKLLVKNGICNVHVINNGIEVSTVPPTYREFFPPLVVGTTGRLTYQKNPVLFNEIAKSFCGDNRVRFVWIGDGELHNAIQIAGNVEITGWLKPEEVQSRLAQIDVYISTALWEGLPYSVLEAMSWGKPLLLFDCIGNRDLVQIGKNGYLYKTKEEAVGNIKTLLKKPQIGNNLGEFSYRLVKQKFSLDEMKIKYRNLYSKL